ncbi:MAG: restriction endonuclease subunit S [Streptococcus mitis]|nr:restriction endonuclease subunit S [Streptococcus mitis]
MTKQPSYRFTGYTEVWEEKKLGEVNDVRDGTHDSPKYVQDGYPLVTSKNLTSEGLDFSDISFISEVDYISINKRSKVETGDIIFGMIGTIGNPVLLKIDGFAIKNVALLKKGGFIDNSFLIQLLQSSSFIKYISLENAGGTQKFLGLSQIRNFQLFSPSLPEQTAIGSFFQDIDQLISLQQRKLEVLKEQKKTYLKLLFSAKGQTKPALRFAGFEDEWKEVKLGEVTNIKTGGRDVQDSVEDGLYPFYIRSEEVKRINSYSFDGEAILIPGEGRLGEIFHYVNGKFDVHQRVYKISNFTDVNAKFVLQQMKKDFKQHAMRNTVKATVDSLRLPTIQSFTVFVPSLPEQEAIGSFFQDLDKAIAKQEEKVNQLKESKQTLLRKMFI